MRKLGYRNVYAIKGGGRALEKYFYKWNGKKYLKPTYGVIKR
jgi:hypothetical protein